MTGDRPEGHVTPKMMTGDRPKGHVTPKIYYLHTLIGMKIRFFSCPTVKISISTP